MKLLLIPLLFFSLALILIPSAFAQVHPLPQIETFDNENQSWCYQEVALDAVTLDGNIGKGIQIQNIVAYNEKFPNGIPLNTVISESQ